jgi:hypothetical protein
MDTTVARLMPSMLVCNSGIGFAKIATLFRGPIERNALRKNYLGNQEQGALSWLNIIAETLRWTRSTTKSKGRTEWRGAHEGRCGSFSRDSAKVDFDLRYQPSSPERT